MARFAANYVSLYFKASVSVAALTSFRVPGTHYIIYSYTA